MKICKRCGEEFEPMEEQLAKKIEPLVSMPKLGAISPQCCPACQMSNLAEAFRILAAEAQEDLVEQGEAVGGGEL